MPIVNGTNYTAAGIAAAITPLLPAGGTATVAGFGGSGTFNNTGFQVTFGGTLAATNVPVMLELGELHRRAPPASSARPTRAARRQQGRHDHADRRRDPGRHGSGPVHDPAADAVRPHRQRDRRGRRPARYYSWEQNDRGAAAGTALLNNTKTNGPLFAMFPKSAPISDDDTLQYNSPDENHLTNDPTRVFPDMQQILDNNTNADTGACPTGPIAPPVPQSDHGVLRGVPADVATTSGSRARTRARLRARLPLHRA